MTSMTRLTKICENGCIHLISLERVCLIGIYTVSERTESLGVGMRGQKYSIPQHVHLLNDYWELL